LRDTRDRGPEAAYDRRDRLRDTEDAGCVRQKTGLRESCVRQKAGAAWRQETEAV
jgi:hypothetical protein